MHLTSAQPSSGNVPQSPSFDFLVWGKHSPTSSKSFKQCKDLIPNANIIYLWQEAPDTHHKFCQPYVLILTSPPAALSVKNTFTLIFTKTNAENSFIACNSFFIKGLISLAFNVYSHLLNFPLHCFFVILNVVLRNWSHSQDWAYIILLIRHWASNILTYINVPQHDSSKSKGA